MTLHFLPCGYWAADVRLNLNGLQTTFRIESAKREWAMASAIVKIKKLLEITK